MNKWTALFCIVLTLTASSCTVLLRLQDEQTTRAYIKNGYQLTPGAHWYDNPAWKAPSTRPTTIEDKSTNLIFKEREPKNVE